VYELPVGIKKKRKVWFLTAQDGGGGDGLGVGLVLKYLRKDIEAPGNFTNPVNVRTLLH
jgi:hypothetical protein